MGKRKRTPTKRALTKQVKRSRGRPRKERPKLTVKRRPDIPISNADRMTIVLLANAGKTTSDISSIVGCSYRAAVNTLLVQSLVFFFLREKRWSERSEEVLRTGSVASKPTSGRTPIFNTPEKQKRLYKKLKKTNVSKLSR